jgi:hypothetical protein
VQCKATIYSVASKFQTTGLLVDKIKIENVLTATILMMLVHDWKQAINLLASFGLSYGILNSSIHSATDLLKL